MNKLQSILENSEYIYEIIKHEKPIKSKQDGVDFFGIDAGQTAPTLIVKTDNDFVVLIISGSREKVDFKEIVELVNCKEAKLASSNEVLKATGYSIGSVPLIGINLPFVIDKKLLTYDFIYGGTGQQNATLKIQPKALLELNQVIKLLD